MLGVRNQASYDNTVIMLLNSRTHLLWKHTSVLYNQMREFVRKISSRR